MRKHTDWLPGWRIAVKENIRNASNEHGLLGPMNKTDIQEGAIFAVALGIVIVVFLSL